MRNLKSDVYDEQMTVAIEQLLVQWRQVRRLRENGLTGQGIDDALWLLENSALLIRTLASRMREITKEALLYKGASDMA